MGLTKEQRDQLMAPVPRTAIQRRKKTEGLYLDYVDGAYVMGLLCEVLGPDGWESSIMEARCVMEREEGGRWRVGYTVHATVAALGSGEDGRSWSCTKSDYGYGSGVDRDQGAAHESALKEACTDAMKRCARQLGWAAGLALYDKSGDHIAEEPAAPQPLILTTPPDPANDNGKRKRTRGPRPDQLAADEFIARIRAATTLDELAALRAEVSAQKPLMRGEVYQSIGKEYSDAKRRLEAGNVVGPQGSGT